MLRRKKKEKEDTGLRWSFKLIANLAEGNFWQPKRRKKVRASIWGKIPGKMEQQQVQSPVACVEQERGGHQPAQKRERDGEQRESGQGLDSKGSQIGTCLEL